MSYINMMTGQIPLSQHRVGIRDVAIIIGSSAAEMMQVPVK